VFQLLMAIAISGAAQTGDSLDHKTFNKVEVEAEFQGGHKGWVSYLQKNLNANVPVNNSAPIGQYMVIVRFIVSKTGKISDVVAETDLGYGMEEEVIRIIKKGPDWLPAEQGGKKVNAYRRQPISFVVTEPGITITAAKNLIKTKENIMLLNIDRVDNENIELTIDNGTIIHEGGVKYKIIPSSKGKAVVDIYVNKNGKRKKRAAAQFSVI
jgi:hypothetical protein